MITISSDVATQLATSTASITDGLFPVIVYLLAVPIAFYVARKLILLFPKK